MIFDFWKLIGNSKNLLASKDNAACLNNDFVIHLSFLYFSDEIFALLGFLFEILL